MVATHSTMQGLGSPMPEFSLTDVTTGRSVSSAGFMDRRAVPSDQKPSMGCNIKWRAGSEPAWFPAG